MSFGYNVTDYQSEELKFQIPGSLGVWEFERAGWYEKNLEMLGRGAVGNTFLAFNEAVTPAISDADFEMITLEFRNICLLLSFQASMCVTPSGNTQGSFAQSVQFGDIFIPPRAIRGFEPLQVIGSVSAFVSNGLPSLKGAHRTNLSGLFFHWLSALTCFSLEDLFLNTCVALDIVKQIEIVIHGNKLEYAEGVAFASARLGIAPINSPFVKMRNSLIHEGQLSGSKFSNKTKAECAEIVADCLNWLDQYILAMTNTTGLVVPKVRWKARIIESALPAYSLV